MAELPRSAKMTVGQFAEGMGLTASENADGAFGFDFERAGRLSILSGTEGNHVLVSLTRRIMLMDAVAIGRFARLGGYQPGMDRLVQTGMTKADEPVLTVAIPPQEFDLPTLDRAFETLDGLHQSVAVG